MNTQLNRNSPGSRGGSPARHLHAGLVLAALALTLAPHEVKANSLAPFKAVFTLVAHGTTAARTTLELVPEGAGLLLMSHTEPAGLIALIRSEEITERSLLENIDGAWRPVSYSYARTGGSRERRAEASFDWEAGNVTGNAKGQPFTYPASPGMLDPLAYLLALMRDGESSERTRRYLVAGNAAVRDYEFIAVAGQSVETDLGLFETVAWQRQGRKNRVTTVYLAPSLSYLPVRIHHREKDGTELVLTLEMVAGRALP